MKKYIHNINQYLLENYPTIWNTKILWMLLISLAIHLTFFVIGYATFTNPELLQERSAITIFFENGTVFFSVMLSILLLVVWLVNLFKNNSFKNFYPTSKLKLFSQFSCYVIIIFFSTTFYFSHNLGFKLYIHNTYADEVIKDEIETTNLAALFFSNDIDDYTIDNLNYPLLFSEIYCEKNKEKIDYDTMYVSWLDYDYQFFTLKSKDRKKSDTRVESTYDNFVYRKDKDSITTTYFYKDSVVDILKYKESVIPTYYNYSDTFYTNGNGSYNYYKSYDNDYYSTEYSQKRVLKSTQVHELLSRNDPKEIKELLQKTLSIINKYRVKHNLTQEGWFKLIYHPEKFELKSLIRKEPKSSYDYNRVATAEQTQIEKFRQEHLTNFYLETDNLRYVFENIEEIKDHNVFEGSIHVFIWISFFLSMFIFIFRITGLKALIFTIVAAGLLTVFVSLITVLYSYLSRGSSVKEEYFILYLLLFIGSAILFSSTFLIDKIKKSVMAVILNLSLISFVLYLFLIVGIVSLHQRDTCLPSHMYINGEECFVLIEELGIYLSYILFVLGFLFIYFYSNIIKKWKGLPEE